MNRASGLLAFLMTVFLVVGLGACAPQATTEAGLTPRELGEIGAQLHHEPERRDEILAPHDLTYEEFRQALREISSDTTMSRQYTESFESTLAELESQ